MNTKFRLKDGQLSRYAFACGYIQRVSSKSIVVTLYHEGAVYQIKGYGYKEGRQPFWESYDEDSLQKARKAFFLKCKEHLGLTKAEVVKRLKEQCHES